MLSVKGLPNTCNDDLESLLLDNRPEHLEDDNDENIVANDGQDFSAFDMQPPDITGNMYKSGFSSSRLKADSSPYFSSENTPLHLDLKRKRLVSPDREMWHNSICEDDEDKLFLLSLVSELKRVPQGMKLDVKCDLLNVFKNARMHYSAAVGENGTDSPVLSDTNQPSNADLDLFSNIKSEKAVCGTNNNPLNENS